MTVTLENDKTAQQQIIVPPGSPFTDYTINVPAGIQKSSPDGGTALLNISAPTWSAQQTGSYDTRALGVQVASVKVDFGF